MSDLINRQATIDVEGLDEQIRCEMCRNPMHTNRGCDGNCKYDERLYERIMQILSERIKPSPSAETRKKGKWIFIHPLQADDEGAYICSNCHRGDWDIKPTDKNCKFCGMAMDIYTTLLP